MSLSDEVQKMRDRASFLLRRRTYYRASFETKAGKQVLADLKRFCAASESPITVSPVSRVVDPIATAVRIGRQEVFQRILTHINIDDHELTNLKEDQS